MRKLTGLRSLKGLRSVVGSTSIANLSSDTGGCMYGSFTNLKIRAEKLVMEQATVKSGIEMAHTKPRRATEQIIHLEEKFQQAVNENAKLKVKQSEYSKLWQGLDSKVASTKNLCGQLIETLQQLFEEKLEKNITALDELNCLLHDLSAKLECAEQTIISDEFTNLTSSSSWSGWIVNLESSIMLKHENFSSEAPF